MARIIVTADPTAHRDQAPVLLEESVQSIHLSSEHGARQLLERLTWALDDADALERDRARPPRRQPAPRLRQAARGTARRDRRHGVSSAAP